MLLLWIEGVRDKRGIEFWCKICGGGDGRGWGGIGHSRVGQRGGKPENGGG